MHLPDYKDGSIVNLISSISKHFGGKPKYLPLKILDMNDLKDSKNIILMVIDGLGYDYLIKNGDKSFLKQHLKNKITSVFPSTTASCSTTFVTGVAPSQHAITGWFMHLKEAGAVYKILRSTPRSGGARFSDIGIDPKKVYSHKTFFEDLNVSSHIILEESLTYSDFNKVMHSKADMHTYKSFAGFFKQTKKIVLKDKNSKYIFAYWPMLDSLSHKYGTKSKKTYIHFRNLDRKIAALAKSLKDTDTTLIITADHGLIDSDRRKTIELKKHPKLVECLTLPLCGETRTAYCYVHPSKARQFEAYVKKHLTQYCSMHKSEDLIKKGYFELFTPNKKLFDRVGDYILIMKKDYVIKDFILGEEEFFKKGYHGGVSKEEMYVPLIVIKT